ncbi:hypothetical protein [Streptomyces sp. NPDC101166]|uniref:hypothetical protein n=1 Tax=Streptomyces sp. NPDC101166 TaxID=3366120 RepID=UPI0038041890
MFGDVGCAASEYRRVYSGCIRGTKGKREVLRRNDSRLMSDFRCCPGVKFCSPQHDSDRAGEASVQIRQYFGRLSECFDSWQRRDVSGEAVSPRRLY